MTSSAGIGTLTPGFQYKHGDRPLEGFTIQRAAGRGGFGEVYFAVSDGGREVALKLIHTYEQIELRGISHCMNLKSPHLITIFDVKYGLDGRPWVIMEYVSGPSLRQLLDETPSGLGVSKAAFFLREIAKGLTYLHECGIVHRDLKPGNIFYENGYVKIGDYGLSKAILAGQNSGQTVTVGTVHYMAPEIGDGRYDKSIDIYALGALLYEMLTGQVPFFGASPTEVLIKHLHAQVDVATVEEPFATVIKKAMAKNPAERYASVQEMVEAVFGSEHVRNSVSHFSPETLTIVAGHVARRLPGNSSFAGASSVTTDNHANDPWGRFGARMHRVVNHGVEAALKPCRRLGRRWDLFGDEHDVRGGAPHRDNVPAADVQRRINRSAAAADPVSAPQRRALAFVAIGLAAIGTGIAGQHQNFVAASTLFAAMAIVAGTAGVLFSSRKIAPGLPDDPKILRRLAVGGFAGLCAAMATLPVGLDNHRRFPDLPGTWFAILACVFFMDWKARTSATRPLRLNIGNVITALIGGVIVGGIFDGSVALVGGIVAGIALATEIASPWNPSAAAARALHQPGAPSAPAMSPASDVSPTILATATSSGLDAPSEATPIDPAAAVTLPVSPATPAPRRLRTVSYGARLAWLILFVALATLGLFLFGMLIFGDEGREDRAEMLGFGSLTLLLAAVCLRRSMTTYSRGIWPYLFRPLLQAGAVGSIVVSISLLTVGEMRASEDPEVVFFIVFPFILLIVMTFLIPTGGGMSQLATQFPSQSGIAPPRDDDGNFLIRIAAGAGQLMLTAVASIILAASVLLAVAVVADVPGIFNSRLVDASVHRNMQHTFGNSDWPRLLRTLGSIGSFVLAAISIFIFLTLRRRSGILHMLRALAAAAMLFAGVMMLGNRLPAWNELMPTSNGWELVDQYLRHVSSSQLVLTAASFILAALLLLWPAGRTRKIKPAIAAPQEAAQ